MHDSHIHFKSLVDEESKIQFQKPDNSNYFIFVY